MKTEIKNIKTRCTVFSDTKEQSIEADIILPDYYPDISKISKCCVDVSNESTASSGDRISLAGKACIKLIFCGDDKKINTYETEVKYTKTIQCSELEATDCISVKQSIINVNYRAVGPRRVEVRALAAVKTEVYRMSDFPSVEDIGECTAQKHYNKIDYFDVNAFELRDITISESSPFTLKNENIKSILRTGCETVINEYETVKNKLMLKGVCEVTAVFSAGDEGKLIKHCYAVPFTEITDIYGITDSDE